MPFGVWISEKFLVCRTVFFSCGESERSPNHAQGSTTVDNDMHTVFRLLCLDVFASSIGEEPLKNFVLFSGTSA